MARINYGKNYVHGQAHKEDMSENNKLNNEGVYFASKSKKWIVRMKNITISKHTKPFISIAQYEKKEDAGKHFNLLTEK